MEPEYFILSNIIKCRRILRYGKLCLVPRVSTKGTAANTGTLPTWKSLHQLEAKSKSTFQRGRKPGHCITHEMIGVFTVGQRGRHEAESSKCSGWTLHAK